MNWSSLPKAGPVCWCLLAMSHPQWVTWTAAATVCPHSRDGVQAKRCLSQKQLACLLSHLPASAVLNKKVIQTNFQTWITFLWTQCAKPLKNMQFLIKSLQQRKKIIWTHHKGKQTSLESNAWSKEKVRDEMQRRKAQSIQRRFCTCGFRLSGKSLKLPRTAWLPVLGQQQKKKGRGEQRGAEERQPLREPWGKVSPSLSQTLPSKFLFSFTFTHLWAAISQQPGSSPYPFRILTERRLTESHNNCTLMYFTCKRCWFRLKCTPVF